MNTTSQEKELERAKSQAKCQLESIQEMVKALDTEDDAKREAATETIREDALEVSVRSDWHEPGAEQEITEYKILLCTGGPAVRIVGDLDRYHEPENATLEYQDWYTPWTEYRLDSEEEAAVVKYAQQFYFGE